VRTTENQRRELEAAAARLGHEIVEVYEDHGISGAKGRDKRPAFDRLHRDITRKKFDLVMAWSVDRLGRSMRKLDQSSLNLHASRQPAIPWPSALCDPPSHYTGNPPCR
jgi:DNA invertase Pin-like site-specific DNA recombinase